MKPTDPRHPWFRLVAAARRAVPTRDESVPFGFSTRVAALAFAQERSVGSLFERFALRAVGLAALLAVGSVVLSYSSLSRPSAPSADEPVATTEDAMSVLLDA